MLGVDGVQSSVVLAADVNRLVERFYGGRAHPGRTAVDGVFSLRNLV